MKRQNFKRGDTRPKIEYQPTEDNRRVSLPSGVTATFRLIDEHDNVALVANGDAAVENADPATLSYEFGKGETDVAGDYEGEFVVEYSDGGTRTFPDVDTIPVSIHPELDADGTVSVGDTRHDVTVGTVDAEVVRAGELSVRGADVFNTGDMFAPQWMVVSGDNDYTTTSTSFQYQDRGSGAYDPSLIPSGMAPKVKAMAVIRNDTSGETTTTEVVIQGPNTRHTLTQVDLTGDTTTAGVTLDSGWQDAPSSGGPYTFTQLLLKVSGGEGTIEEGSFSLVFAGEMQ